MRMRRGIIAGATSLALVAMGVTLPSLPSSGAPPVPGDGRLAFTDGQDTVRAVSLDRTEFGDGTPALLPVYPADWRTVESLGGHSGEARGAVNLAEEPFTGGFAFVSSRPSGGDPANEDPDGEVWYQSLDLLSGSTRHIQVTDDVSAQAHPDAWVVDDCLGDGPATIDIAFASDRSGNWDIWVARLVRDPAPGSGCEDLVVESVQQVTDDPADDLWPSWGRSASGVRSLVFSSTRTDPRGDLYSVVLDPGDPLPPAASAYTQLTEGPEADSQPSARIRIDDPQVCPGDPGAAAPVEPRWVAFTRASDGDPRGGLAVVDLDDPGGGVLSLGVPASSEPAWSEDGGFLAYRSTAEDPDGDVLLGRFVRSCPPDLAVESVTVSPQTLTLGFRLDTFVRVVNNGPEPASGEVVVEFPPLVQNPSATECVAGVCTLPVPMLAPGEVVEYAWTSIEFPPPEMVVVGPAPVTIALGDGTITATVSVSGPVPDGVPSNDTGSADFSVLPDLGIVSVALAPSDLVQLDTPLEIRVRVTNPGSAPVAGELVVELPATLLSDPDGCTGGACTIPVAALDGGAVREYAWAGAASPGVETELLGDPPITILTGSGSVGATVSVDGYAEDANPGNDSGSATFTVVEIIGAPPTGLAFTDGFLRRSAPATVVHASLPTAAQQAVPAAHRGLAPVRAPFLVPHAALVPFDVPPAVKPPVEDSVSLEWVIPVSATFGVSESHPAFGSESVDGVPQPVLMLTERASWSVISEVTVDPESGVDVESRPATSSVSDVVSRDGSGRQVVVDGATGAVGRPAYSPDGRFVAFDRAICDRQLASGAGCALWGSEIVIASADGAGPQAVYPSSTDRPAGALDRNPAWSPDGTSLAYTRHLPGTVGENSAIWLAEGLSIDTVTVAPEDLLADTLRQLTTPGYAETVGEVDEFDDEAAWSPDGGRIAFTRGRIDTSYLTSVYETSIGSDILPEYRPTPGMHDQDIWLVDVGSAAETPLLAEEVGADPSDEECPESSTTVCFGGDDRGPDWSPDGARIVYEHTGWVYLADPATGTDLGPVTGPRVLDPAADLPTYPDDELVPPPADPASPAAASFPALEWAQDPAWSPDGDRVAFAGQPRGRPEQRGIYWLTMAGGAAEREIREIAQQPQPEFQADWQPTADLAITLTAAPADVLVGGGSVLTAEVTNEGPATAYGSTMAVTLPAGLEAGTLPAGCAAGPPVTCTLGDLADGASVPVAIPVTGVTAGAQVATATTTSRTVDPDPADNTASATVTIGTPTADLAITLTAVPESIPFGTNSVLTAVVTNSGPTTALGSTMTLTLPAGLAGQGTLPAGCVAGPPISCALGDLASGISVPIAIPVIGTVAGVQTSTALAQSTTVDTDPSNNTATASITVAPPEADVSVEIEVSPVPGYVGGSQTVTVTVANGGPQATTVNLTVDLPEEMGAPDDDECLTDAGCSVGAIEAGATVVREIDVEPTEAFTRRATARVTGDVSDPDLDNNVARVRVEVLQPRLLLLPPLGPPGFVTRARGEDFPPGARVRLEWDVGLNASVRPIRVAADGTFNVPVVVLHRDQLGPRTVDATRVRGLRFAPVSADFLVVPRTQAPPEFVGRG